MASSKCFFCKTELSPNIEKECPTCREPDPLGKIARRKRKNSILVLIASFAAAAGLYWIMHLSGQFPPDLGTFLPSR